MMFGRLPVRDDVRTLRSDAYFGLVSPPPIAVDWQRSVPSWPMYANDRIGCCTVSAAGHLVGEWSDDAGGSEVLFTDADIVAMYAAVSGFDPSTGANDNGADELTVLNYWRNTGLAGHRIAAYVKVDHSNPSQVREAVNVFGGVYIGFSVPRSAMTQFDAGEVWDVVGSDGGIVGGHAVPVGAYDGSGFECVTWGRVQRMTSAFWDRYVEEVYAVLSPDWVAANRADPQGFDLVQLQADLVAIGANRPNPSPTPTPTPVPPAPVPPAPPAPVPPAAGLTVTFTDPVLSAKIVRAAQMRNLAPDEYVAHRMAVYFGPGRRVFSVSDESLG